MQWEEIRNSYPQKWILVEAIKAHSEQGKRILEQLTVINNYSDSLEAMNQYKELHKQFPDREFYVLHTKKEKIEIIEKRWLGIRGI
jgi:hypothetical protein